MLWIFRLSLVIGPLVAMAAPTAVLDDLKEEEISSGISVNVENVIAQDDGCDQQVWEDYGSCLRYDMFSGKICYAPKSCAMPEWFKDRTIAGKLHWYS